MAPLACSGCFPPQNRTHPGDPCGAWGGVCAWIAPGHTHLPNSSPPWVSLAWLILRELHDARGAEDQVPAPSAPILSSPAQRDSEWDGWVYTFCTPASAPLLTDLLRGLLGALGQATRRLGEMGVAPEMIPRGREPGRGERAGFCSARSVPR